MQAPPTLRRHPLIAALATVALLVGCATPRDGQDETTYYYQARSANAVAPVVATPPAAAPQQLQGPQGVARLVYFDFDRSDVRAQDVAIVQAHAEYLRSRPQAKVQLEGHTDVRGGSEYNLALGQRRAESVHRMLRSGGAAPSQLEATSWGKERLASREATEEGHQLNRRVEFIYR